DHEVWDPMTDPEIPANYGPEDMSGKIACKQALLEEFSLPMDLERPVIASITRLTDQKGVDLMMAAAGDILAAGAYIVSLGSGEAKYEKFWQSLRDYAPHRVG